VIASDTKRLQENQDPCARREEWLSGIALLCSAWKVWQVLKALSRVGVETPHFRAFHETLVKTAKIGIGLEKWKVERKSSSLIQVHLPLLPRFLETQFVPFHCCISETVWSPLNHSS
jgi:hypothetical protein